MTLRHDVQHPQPGWVKWSLGNAPCSDGCITILSDDSVSGTQARTGLPAKSLSHLMSCVAHFTCQAKPSLKSPAVMHTHMHARTHAHTHSHTHTYARTHTYKNQVSDQRGSYAEHLLDCFFLLHKRRGGVSFQQFQLFPLHDGRLDLKQKQNPAVACSAALVCCHSDATIMVD